MTNPITIDKGSEFFVTIAKEGIHSFLMLGVMIDKQPTLLARVGKSNLIDKDFGLGIKEQLIMLKKAIVNETDAYIENEGIRAYKDYTSDISYQAYSINYEQYLEFLKMTKTIHQAQRQLYETRIRDLPEDTPYSQLSYPQRGVYKLSQGIECYIPTNMDGEEITLDYQNIDSFDPPVSEHPEAARQDIIADAHVIKASNTCRTTAKAVLNYTLKYSPEVPALYAFELRFKTRIEDGVLNANTFYILPPPPSIFSNASPTQKKVLEAQYKLLENLPKNHADSPETRAKFDKIKELYIKTSGPSDLSLADLLDHITAHRIANNELFAKHRGQSIVSKLLACLGVKTNTNKAYNEMEKEVRKELAKVGTMQPTIDKDLNEEVNQHDDLPPLLSP